MAAQYTSNDPVRWLEKIYVEENCFPLDYTREILQRLPDLPVEVIPEKTLPLLTQLPYARQLNSGKRHLLLSRNRGKFFKSCPATREYICCGYHVLNIGMNCPMDCVYCILQAYMNNPWLSFYVNIDDLYHELDEILTANPDNFYRIGTGEFTDSMALDNLTHLSSRLVHYMGDKNNAVLELKTKTAIIDNLADLDHQGRTILSWSLNSPEIMAKEEIRTASLEERLKAASQGAQWGYRLAFHFDPIIYYPDWKTGYRETIERLFSRIDPGKIVWISMGALRFLPSLKQIADDRFPKSIFFSEEFVPGLDGKSRYFRALRTEMYGYIYSQLQRFTDARTCIYLCMESEEIWREVFGFSPEDKGGLNAMLDSACS